MRSRVCCSRWFKPPPPTSRGRGRERSPVSSDDGSPKEDTALLILDQKEATVTGTVGGSQDDQFPITSGTVEGNKVTLVAKKEDGREFRVELTFESDQLKGTVASGARTGKLQVRRRKE